MLCAFLLSGCVSESDQAAVTQFVDDQIETIRGDGTGTSDTAVPALAVTVDSPDTYASLTLSMDTPIYTDRDFVFTAIPSEYDGAIYIQTANDDKFVADSAHLQLTTNVDAVVHVVYSQQISNPPAWLADWTRASATLPASHNVTYDLFYKTFAAGSVTLGGNEMGFSSYAVIVLPAGT